MSKNNGRHQKQQLIDLFVIEYDQLKQEQRERIKFRDNLLYVTLASMAAVGFVAIQYPERPVLLLLLPMVSFVLGWNYTANDQKVSAIGQYIRAHLAPHLSRLIPGRPLVFGWELANQSDPHRATRKITWLTVDLVVFVVAPLVAIGIVWTQEPAVSLRILSAIETAAIAALAVQIIRHSFRSITRRRNDA